MTRLFLLAAGLCLTLSGMAQNDTLPLHPPLDTLNTAHSLDTSVSEIC